MPSKFEIAMYWHYEDVELAMDPGEPSCFACGYFQEYWDKPSTPEARWEIAALQKCHLTPRALGGSDEADNLVLLCADCHRDAPDVLDPQWMLAWMHARPSWLERSIGQLASLLADFGVTVEVAAATVSDPVFREWAVKKVVPHFGEGISLSSWVSLVAEYVTAEVEAAS